MYVIDIDGRATENKLFTVLFQKLYRFSQKFYKQKFAFFIPFN